MNKCPHETLRGCGCHGKEKIRWCRVKRSEIKKDTCEKCRYFAPPSEPEINNVKES